MWKSIVAGTAALAIVGTSMVYAQRGREEGRERWQPSMEDFRAFGEARLAALKAGLTLTPEQEKNWPAFEQAARELGKLRLDRISARRNAPRTDDPVERLRQRATSLSDTGAALKKLALNRLAGPGGGPHFRDRFGWREGGWFHFGPNRTQDDGTGHMERSGAERL